MSLKDLPADRRTPEACLEAVRRDGLELGFVPERMRTEALCRASVENAWVEVEELAYQEYDGTYHSDGIRRTLHWGMPWVPERLFSPKLAMAAIYALRDRKEEKDVNVLKELAGISGKLIDAGVCRAAVQGNGWALAYVPCELKTPEICMEAVKQDGEALAFVPDALKTPEMCLIAVQNDGGALDDVPEAMRTEKVCLAACRRDAECLSKIPAGMAERIAPEVCRLNCFALENIPMKGRTPEVCLAAGMHMQALIRRGAARIESACDGKPWHDERIPYGWGDVACLMPNGMVECVRRWLDAGLERPPEGAEEEVRKAGAEARKEARKAAAWEAVWEDPKNLKYVADDLKTAELCMEAVKQEGAALRWVPDALKTPELCLAAVMENGRALAYVPKEMKMEELCLEAVKQDGWALKHVPEELKTPAVCLEAVRLNREELEYVPEALRDFVAAWLDAGLAKPPAGSLDVACAAFASCAEKYVLPEGCSFSLEARRLDGGRLSLCVLVLDPDGAGWTRGTEPCVKAVYQSNQAQTEADPAACLRAFAEKLEGKAGRPAEGMPPKMKAFCARAVRRAAEAFEACSAAPECGAACPGPRR